MSDKLQILLSDRKLDVAVKKLDTVEYFHAKTIHEAAEVHTQGNKPDSFLRMDDTKAYIITRTLMGENTATVGSCKSDGENSLACNESLENSLAPVRSLENSLGSNGTLDCLILKDAKGGEYNVAELEQRDAYLAATHMQRLPAELEEGIVFTPSRSQGSYFREDLMMKYAQYLDKKLEAACLDALNALRKFEQLPAEKKVDILIDTATEILREDLHPKQSAEKRLETKTKTKYLFSVLDSMIPVGEDKAEYYQILNGGTNLLFKHTSSEMKELASGSKSPREYMSDSCIYAIELVEGFVCSDLLGMRSARVKLTKAQLAKSLKEALAKVEPSLFKWTDEIDFLANENKKTKILTEVTLKSDYTTSKLVTNLKQLT